MSDDERFHASLVALNRLIRGGAFPGETREVAGWLLTDAGTGLASLNQAFVIDPALAAASLSLVERWFDGRADGFRAILRDSADAPVIAAATSRGYAAVRSQPLMAAKQPLPQYEIPAGFVAAPVQSAQDIRDYLGVREPSPSRPSDETEGEFIAAVMATGRFRYFVARHGNRPVATASAALAEDVVHVSNVWVADDARRKGLGAAMTALAAAAFDGTGWAALEASAMGEPVYRRMGFEERYRYVQMSQPDEPG